MTGDHEKFRRAYIFFQLYFSNIDMKIQMQRHLRESWEYIVDLCFQFEYLFSVFTVKHSMLSHCVV